MENDLASLVPVEGVTEEKTDLIWSRRTTKRLMGYYAV